MRFNIAKNKGVVINFKLDKEITEKEALELYFDLLSNAKILFSKKNKIRRALIIKNKEKHWFVSVVKKGSGEDMLFCNIDKDEIRKNIKNIKKVFKNERKNIFRRLWNSN